MGTAELVFTILLVLLLLGLGGFYTWRQIRLLRRLRQDPSFTPLERQYLRRQGWRRLFCSALLIVLAVLLAGPVFFQGSIQSLAEAGRQHRAEGDKHEATPDEVRSLQLFGVYTLVLILLFVAIVLLAVLDALATRRFTLRQLQQMTDQHQQLLREQAARLREARDGPG